MSAKIIKLLLDNGADIADKNQNGNGPLHCAAQAGKVENTRYLIQCGAKTNARKNDFNTPLHLASINKNKAGVEVLLVNGANPELINKRRNNFLHEIRCPDTLNSVLFSERELVKDEVVKKLVNAPDENGNTPLLLAIMRHTGDIAGLLMDAGANPYIRNKVRSNAQELIASPHVAEVVAKKLEKINAKGG
jgi:ankyrin repeat protein